MKLNLASGQAPKDGWVNVDIEASVKPDVVLDLLTFPWPWETGSADEIFCSHFLEHTGQAAIPFLNECWRVLKPGGTAHFVTPYYTSVRAWQDPTHKWAISESFYSYFSREWREENGVSHYQITSDFIEERRAYHFYEEWKDKSQEELEWAIRHLWNVVADMEILLRARK